MEERNLINMSEEAYLLSNDSLLNLSANFNIEEVMGPRRDPLGIALVMTLVYTLILTSGIIGNVCTCVVIARNSHMHTATNYYLFSLAISDLLLLVLGFPQELHLIWNKYPYQFGEFFCLLRGWASEASTNASVLTITSFTIERYLAICHPLKAHAISSLSRAVRLIVFVWICAATSAVLIGYQFGIVYESDDHGRVVLETAICGMKRHLPNSFEISTFAFFVFPATLLSILYILIGLQLRRSECIRRKTNGSAKLGKFANRHQMMKKPTVRKDSVNSRKVVVNMLIAVVVAFFFCWAPFHTQRLMAVWISHPTETDARIFGVITHISGIFYYVSATINPILYSIMSLKFRHAFKETLGKCFGGAFARRSRKVSFGLLRSMAHDGTSVTVVSQVPLDNDRPTQEKTNNVKKFSISNSSLQVEENAFDDVAITCFVDDTDGQ